MPRLAGPNILRLGEHWREKFLKGKPAIQIADEAGKSLQVISRSIWLGGWPNHLKELVLSHPSIFTRSVLINGFASKQRQCERDNYVLLEREMKRMLEAGSGTKPKLRKTNKKAKPVEGSKASPLFHIEKAHESEYRIKKALSLHNRVTFEEKGAGEVRIFFSNEKDLEFILERLEDLRFSSTQEAANNNKDFWDLLS